MRDLVDECGISQPVGIDAYGVSGDGIPSTRQRYEVSDTPHLAIVDKQGMLRFTHSGAFDPESTEWFLQRLLEEPPATFDRELETFSEGERKKVDLCRSFLDATNLLLWDEPMNYVDLMSREQIEAAILECEPTMLFVEHDRWFVERIATGIVEMPAATA